MNTYLMQVSSGWDLLYLMKYLAVVLLDGDYLNDWLTWLPSSVAPSIQVVGEWIAGMGL